MHWREGVHLVIRLARFGDRGRRHGVFVATEEPKGFMSKIYLVRSRKTIYRLFGSEICKCWLQPVRDEPNDKV